MLFRSPLYLVCSLDQVKIALETGASIYKIIIKKYFFVNLATLRIRNQDMSGFQMMSGFSLDCFIYFRKNKFLPWNVKNSCLKWKILRSNVNDVVCSNVYGYGFQYRIFIFYSKYIFTMVFTINLHIWALFSSFFHPLGLLLMI